MIQCSPAQRDGTKCHCSHWKSHIIIRGHMSLTIIDPWVRPVNVSHLTTKCLRTDVASVNAIVYACRYVLHIGISVLIGLYCKLCLKYVHSISFTLCWYTI